MPIGAAVGAGISGAVNIAKTIYGARQAKKGEKQMNEAIESIKYSRPEEYSQIMNILGTRTDSLTSRREAVEGRVRRGTAAGQSGIRQLADSPVAALTAYSGLKERETQAISDIGIEFESMRDQNMMDEARGLQMGADYSDKESYYNDMYKKMVRANIGASKMGAGANMLGAGIEGVAGTAMDYLGTRYLGNKMNPQKDTTLGGVGSITDPVPEDGGSLANM